MTRYTFTVDTRPMGEAIDHVAHEMHHTSVVVAKTAQNICEAEVAAADKVSRHVTKGFHTLVLTQLNQKMAKLKSSLQANDALLVAEKRTVDRMRGQFINDFVMIKRRYYRLFDNLNRTLRNRVWELDKPLTSILDSGYRNHVKARNNNLAMPGTIASESQTARQSLEISRTKQQALNLIENIRKYIVRSCEVHSKIEALVDPKPCGENHAVQIHLPALFFQAGSHVTGVSVRDLYFPGNESTTHRLYPEMINAIGSINFDQVQWNQIPEAEYKGVMELTKELILKAELSEREIKTMQALISVQTPWLENEGAKS